MRKRPSDVPFLIIRRPDKLSARKFNPCQAFASNRNSKPRVVANANHAEQVPTSSHKRRSSRRQIAPLHLAFDHHLLDFGDGLRRIEMRRAGVSAIHYGMATVEPERVF